MKTLSFLLSFLLVGCVTTPNSGGSISAVNVSPFARQFEISDTNKDGLLDQTEYGALMYLLATKKLEDAGVRPNLKKADNVSAQQILRERDQDIAIADAVMTSFARMDTNRDKKLTLQEYELGLKK